MAENHERDVVILFHSNSEKARKILERFLVLGEGVYSIENNRKILALGYFDMSKNSH